MTSAISPEPRFAREWALVTLNDPVKVQGLILMGRYVFEHDLDRMARGEPCTTIYEQPASAAPQRLLSFHCRPFGRPMAEKFTIVTTRNAENGIRDLVAYQFSGSAEAHGIPKGR